MNLEIANKLLALRKKNNLSQEDLAEKMGVSRQAISKWERGEASPDTDNLILLANLYRISLDELLNIDVKTFKSDYTPPIDFDEGSQKTIKLSKSSGEESEFEYFNSSKRVVYPKNSLDEEIYLNNKHQEQYNKTVSQDFKDPIQNDVENNINQTYQQSNPIIPMTEHNRNNKKSKKRGFFKRKNRGNNGNPPPFTNNKFINKFESIMKKLNISYKGLYTFPIYAIGIALAILFGNFGGYDSGYLSMASLLGIPLYYTLINAIQKRNANRFGYPILALMLTFIGNWLIDSDISALWLATIPFYYWFINKNK